MSQPPESAPTPEYVGPPGTPPGPPAAPPPSPPRPNVIEIDLSRLPSAATAFGISLVGAAIVVSAVYARMHDGLDGSVFTVGVLATLGLLVVAVGAQLLAPSLDKAAALVSWPGAFGTVGAGLLLAVLLNDDDSSLYFGSLLIVVLSIAGYLLSKGGPFVVSGIVGLALLYGKVFDDVIDLGGDGENTFMIIGAAVLIFVFLVTLAGWLLPETRTLSAMVVGVGGLGAIFMIFQFLTITGVMRGAMSGDSEEFPDSVEAFHSPYENDIWMLLVYSLALAILWIGCSLGTGFVGFRLLVVAIGVIAVPMATIGLVITHPTRWEIVLAVIGGAILLGAGYRAVQDSTK